MPKKTMDLNLKELVLINNAINEILNGPSAIDHEEFQLRTGVEVEDAQLLLARVSQAIEARNAQ